MAETEIEIERLIHESPKLIAGDITWSEDEDHSPAYEFRADITTQEGYPLLVKGSYNREAGTLIYCLILRSVGPIYRLDLGKEHHNPSCKYVGEVHKHTWSAVFGDKEAYVPQDITEPATNPLAVWDQFCAEAGIRHLGLLKEPPPEQIDLF